AGTMAFEQIELLKSENINLEYMSFGHMDRNLDPYYHEQVAKTGAFLSFDGISKIKYAPESDRIKGILELDSKGYEDQILVSGDTARKSYYKHYDYGLGLENIISKWVARFIDEANLIGYDGELLISLLVVSLSKSKEQEVLLLFFQNKTSYEIKKNIKESGIAILPVGAVEAHGPHLPLGTDNLLAERVAEKVATGVDGLILPT